LDGERRPEEAAMKSSFNRPATLEQRAARKAAIDGMNRALHELWKDEPASIFCAFSLDWNTSKKP
jgi:hypothetical protein